MKKKKKVAMMIEKKNTKIIKRLISFVLFSFLFMSKNKIPKK